MGLLAIALVLACLSLSLSAILASQGIGYLSELSPRNQRLVEISLQLFAAMVLARAAFVIWRRRVGDEA